MGKCLAVLALALSFVVISIVADAREELTSPLLVRMDEWQTSMKPTAGPIVVGNCVAVSANGHLRLELRRQESPEDVASLISYEANLTPEQVNALRDRLDSANVQHLPRLIPPKTPFKADSTHSFRARIARDVGVQEIGFIAWEGEGPMNSEADKHAWQDAKAALQSLVEWFHMLKNTNSILHKIPNANGVCGEPAD